MSETEGKREGRGRKKEKEKEIRRDWKRKWEISGNLAPFHFPGASERKSERVYANEKERSRPREETRARAENLFLECLCDFVRIIITSKREKGLRGAVAVVVVARYGRKISMSSACSIRDRTKEQPCRS